MLRGILLRWILSVTWETSELVLKAFPIDGNSILRENNFFHSEYSSVAWSSECSVEALQIPHPTLACLLVTFCFTSCLGSHVGKTSDTIKRHILTANSVILWFFHSFYPRSTVFLRPWVQEYFVDFSIGAPQPWILTFFLYWVFNTKWLVLKIYI